MNVLLSLGNDLASSIALRYLSQQAADFPMTIQPLHIEVEDKHFPLGTGWVKNTWKDTVVSSSEVEINNFIHNEIRFCRSLSPAITRIGDGEKQILKELQNGNYQLFAMGLLSSFSSKIFYNLLASELMTKSSCPVLFIKNLRDFKSVTILCKKGMNIKKLAREYLNMYGKASVDLQLLHVEPDTDKEQVTRSEQVPVYLQEIGDALATEGCVPKILNTLTGAPQAIAEILKNQGMVVSSFNKTSDTKSPFFDILAYVPTPVLLFWS